MSLQFVTIVVIYIYSCYLQLFLYSYLLIKSIYLNAVYQHIDYLLHLFCINSYSLKNLIYCESVHVL